jgi:hypothetical protein
MRKGCIIAANLAGELSSFFELKEMRMSLSHAHVFKIIFLNEGSHNALMK